MITIRSRHVGRDVDIVDSRRFRRRPLRHQRRLGKRRRCVRHCSIVRWRWRRRRRWCRCQRRPVSKFDAAKIWEDLIFCLFLGRDVRAVRNKLKRNCSNSLPRWITLAHVFDSLSLITFSPSLFLWPHFLKSFFLLSFSFFPYFFL